MAQQTAWEGQLGADHSGDDGLACRELNVRRFFGGGSMWDGGSTQGGPGTVRAAQGRPQQSKRLSDGARPRRWQQLGILVNPWP